jgi:hypothetical protein
MVIFSGDTVTKTWTQLKAIAAQSNLPIQYDTDANGNYQVFIVSGDVTYYTYLYTQTPLPVGVNAGQNTTDLTDFTNNYQASANNPAKLSQASQTPTNTATGALGALNAVVSVSLNGCKTVGFQLAAGTLIGTIIGQLSFDGGTTWTNSYFELPITGNIVSSIVFASSNAATSGAIVGAGGATNAQVIVSAYTSGTANITVSATMDDNIANLTQSSPGAVLPPNAHFIGGTDGTNLRGISATAAGSGASTGVLTVQGNAAGTPIPISGSITATNPSVGTIGSTAPTSSTYMGILNGANLIGALGDSSGRLIVAGAGTAGTATGGVLSVQGVAGGTTIPVTATISGTPAVTVTGTVSGTGTAGAAATGVLTVQGITSMTPIQVSQATAGNLNATVVGSGNFTVVQGTATNLNAAVVGVGTAGTPSGGVLTVQGSSSGTALPISGSVSATISGTPAVTITSGTTAVTQATAASLNATVIGAGSAGSANAGVVTIQGIASMTPVQVSQATAANLNATVVQTTAANLNATVAQGTANTLANAWSTKITDATNGPVAVKPASTAVVAADPALVVAISPNSVDNIGYSSQGYVASSQFWSTTTPDHPIIDPSGLMGIRGNVTSDDQSLYDCFSNAIPTNLTGTCSFTNGSTNVTGSGTSFLTQVNFYSYLKVSGDSETQYVRIANVISNTQLTLASNYGGTTGTGQTGVVSNYLTTTGSGTISISNSNVLIGSGTTSANVTGIFTAVDYLPVQFIFLLNSLSQRIANQNFVIGLQDTTNATPSRQAVLVFNGTNNAQVIIQTSDNASVQVNSTTVTLPNSLTTASKITFTILLKQTGVYFYANNILLGSNLAQIPNFYINLNAVAYWNNTGTPASNTTASIDTFLIRDFEDIQTAVSNLDPQLLQAQIQGPVLSGATSTANPIIIGGVDGSGLARSATVTSAGTSVSTGVLTIQGNASGVPIPISGSISATNPSVGTIASTAPTSGTYIGVLNGANLIGALGDSSGRQIIAGAGTASSPAGGILTVQGPVATATAIASAAYPVLIAGSDGSNLRSLTTDSSGRQVVVSPTAANFLATVTQGAGSGAAATYWYNRITDGTNTMPTMDAVARRGYLSITDGTNTMPTGDVTARSIFVQQSAAASLNATAAQGAANTLANAWSMKITDATNGPVAVKATGVAAATTDPSLVVAISPNINGSKTSANSIPVVIASDQAAVAIKGASTPAAGFANPTTAVPTQDFLQLYNGTTWDLWKGTTALGAFVSGPVASGNAAPTNPILIGGSNGTNVYSLNSDTSGRLTVAGGGTAGSAVGGVLTVQGVASMTPVQVSQATAANLNATVVQGTGSGSAATYWYNRITDGTNTLPTMDVAARKGFQAITDGTNTVAVKAASTAAVASDPALVVAISPNNTVAVTQSGTWSITTSNASVGTIGSTAPTSANYIGVLNGSNLIGALGDSSGRQVVVGAGTAGTATGGVVTVQGVASMTPILSTVTGTVSGTGTAGTAATGVLTVQGITSMTPIQVSQATASNLNAAIVGTGSAGTAATGVVTIQGIASMTPVQVTATPITDGAPATQTITAQDTGSTNTTVAYGQVFVTGTPTAGSAASFAISTWTTGHILVTGSWTGTLVIETSMDGGTTWLVRRLHLDAISGPINSFTANFDGIVSLSSCTNVRVRSTAAWTGTATVKLLESVNESIVYNFAAIQPATASTSAITQVAASVTSVVLKASNTSRLGLTIMNDSTSVLYVKFGATASTTSYTVKMTAGQYYEMPFGYTGEVDGIWLSAAGNAYITELQQ